MFYEIDNQVMQIEDLRGHRESIFFALQSYSFIAFHLLSSKEPNEARIEVRLKSILFDALLLNKSFIENLKQIFPKVIFKNRKGSGAKRNLFEYNISCNKKVLTHRKPRPFYCHIGIIIHSYGIFTP